MTRYSKNTQRKVHEALHKYKKGTLKSGKSDKKVSSQKQAVAIGLSEARKKGYKAPPQSTT